MACSIYATLGIKFSKLSFLGGVTQVLCDMWVSFKSEVIAAIERFIPTKMTKTKYSLPWIDSLIRRLISKHEKLYFRARKSSSPDIKNHYKGFRAHVQQVIRDAYWKHISNIFSFETESPDPDSPRKNEKAKMSLNEGDPASH